MSGEEDLRYLCDGMTEGIIANLSRFRDLFVIARHSSFAYQDTQMRITEIAKELGVRYLLEGSILKIGEKIRMIAQLIDATTSYHVWANNYDHSIQKIPQIHDEVTQLIVAALPLRLEDAEKIRMRSVETEDLDAFGYLLRGQEVFLEYTRLGHAKALKLFEKAIECDPNYARAYAAMSRVQNHENRYSWTDTPELTLKKALEFAHKAIQLDSADARGYSELGIVHLYMKNVDLAIAHFEKALSLNPNDADIIAELADAHVYAGRPEKGLELLKIAMRLNPYSPDSYLWKLADAYFVLRDYRGVIKTAQGMQNPSEADRLVAASYAHLGDIEKARTHASEMLRKHPNFTVSAWAKNQPDTDPSEVEHLSDGLRKAGLPD
jgi:TolB-like protein